MKDHFIFFTSPFDTVLANLASLLLGATTYVKTFVIYSFILVIITIAYSIVINTSSFSITIEMFITILLVELQITYH